MKKFLSILLILLITFNAGGYFFIYYQLENHFKQVAHEEINDYVPIDKLELIKITRIAALDNKDKDFERVNDDEILYRGKMYDIYKEENINDTIFLYCLNDEKEDIIEKAFAEYINEKNDVKTVSSVINIIKILITLGVQPEFSEYNHFLTLNNLLYLYNNTLQKICIDIPSPPPKTIT